jgi:hypothetical protein
MKERARRREGVVMTVDEQSAEGNRRDEGRQYIEISPDWGRPFPQMHGLLYEPNEPKL